MYHQQSLFQETFVARKFSVRAQWIQPNLLLTEKTCIRPSCLLRPWRGIMTVRNWPRLAAVRQFAGLSRPLAQTKHRLVGFAALAVLLLMPPGIHSAKAAVQYCDIAAENCYYGGDGRGYYLAPGSAAQKAYSAGKFRIPDFVERHRKERECALHANNGSCRVGPVPRRHRLRP